MKNIFTVLSLVSFAMTHGQTITQSFNEPVVGDIDKNYRLDTSAFASGLPRNVVGNNCIWNYTNLNAVFPKIVASFISPAAAASASAYPSANYVQRRDIYTFYKSTTNPQQTELLGGYTPSLSLIFSNTAIIAKYPVSYGYNFSDPVSGTFKYNTTNGACVGNITISADGLGTLNLPGGASLTNVLRLKSVEILTLSIGVFPFGTFNQTIYNYYMPGKKFPVLNLNYSTYRLIAGSPTITAFVYGNINYFNIVGFKDESANKEAFSVYPNPFSDHLSIVSKLAGEENTYTFYNANGTLILQANETEALQTEKIEPGIYFLEIRNRLGTFHQKVIKE